MCESGLYPLIFDVHDPFVYAEITQNMKLKFLSLTQAFEISRHALSNPFLSEHFEKFRIQVVRGLDFKRRHIEIPSFIQLFFPVGPFPTLQDNNN